MGEKLPLFGFPALLPLLVAQGASPQFVSVQRLIDSGDYGRALGVLSSIRCLPPQEGPPCEARVHSMQGAAHLFSGHYDQALEHFSEGLRRYRQMHDRRHAVDLLNNLGTVHFYRGEYAEAHTRYRAAQTELDGGPREAWFASAAHLTAANVATLYQRLGRYRLALEAYQRLGRAPEGLSKHEQAQLLSNLAVLNRRLGDPWKCRALLEQSLSLLAAGMHRDTWLGVIKNLGIVLALDFRDLEAAERRFKQALREAERFGGTREATQARLYLAETLYRRGDHARALALWRRVLDESRRLSSAEDEWRSLFGIARVLGRNRDSDEAEAALAGCMKLIEALRGGIGAATLKTEFLSDKNEVYDEAISAAAGRHNLEAAFQAMERARALLLKESLPGRRTDVSLPQFQARLQPGEAALLYRAGTARSFLLWATRDAAGLHELDVREAEAARWIQLLRDDVDGAAAPKRALSALLLDAVPPLADKSVRRLWIVPDGVFSFLPFELLPAGGKVLIERFQIAYLPAAGFLRSDAAPKTWARWPWQKQLVAYAEPDVRKARLLPGDERWRPLAQSGAEISAISKILPGASVAFRGASVGPEQLLDRVGEAPVLHLATHGAGDPETEERNRVLIGPSYLYGSQLLRRRFPTLRLAVLSACETETGPLRHGEGVQSLARAFLMAGAHATVASLWKVDDAAARLFMEEFYGQLASGLEIASALRETKLRFLRSGGPLRQPRYWAAFVVQGSAAEPLPRWLSWPQLLGAAAGLLGALASISWVIRRKRRGA